MGNGAMRPNAADVLVYAPVGAFSLARDFLPGFVAMCVARGRSELEARQEQLEDQIARARSVGQMVTVAGPPFLERQLEEARARADEALAGLGVRAAQPPAGVVGVDTSAGERAPQPSTNGAPTGTGAASGHTTGASGTELPIPDYDALAATQVVDRLGGLDASELETVREYEAAHRGRKTILGRIEQLAR